MELIPKDIDTRNLLKHLLSKAFPGKNIRYAKIQEKVRRKYGDEVVQQKYLRKDDKYYLKLGDFFQCGKHGEMQVDKDGNKRYLPYFCNLRKECLGCFNRYKKGLKVINETRILEAARARPQSLLVFTTYTLHPEIRHYLTTCDKSEKVELLNKVTNLWVESFKRAIGLGGHRGRGITGIISVTHPFGSRNPFQDFLHFHGVWIPLEITKDGRLKEMRSWVDVNKARAIWQKAQEDLAGQLGISLAGSETNVHFQWVPLSTPGKALFKIKYIFRSLLKDIFLSVRYITDDLNGFIWCEDKEADWLPHVDTWDVLKNAIDSYVNFPVKMVRSYGFLRNLKRYADVLGLVRVYEAPDFIPVETVRCEFRRSIKRQYDDRNKRYTFQTIIHAKIIRGDWKQISINDMIGECSSGGTRYRYIRAP